MYQFKKVALSFLLLIAVIILFSLPFAGCGGGSGGGGGTSGGGGGTGGGGTTQTAPVITSISPNTVYAGSSIIINGTGFGTGGTLLIGAATVNSITWTDTVITATVPTTTAAGTITVTVTPTGATAATSSLTISSIVGGGWIVRYNAANANILESYYGAVESFPQYAALHIDSSYLRLVYGPESGWGTSAVLMPSFWENGVYHQGAPISVNWTNIGNVLVISFTGTISNLKVTKGEIRLSPPAQNQITAQVTVNTSGSVQLDSRPGEAFKPVMLSSMHISDTQWDSQSAYIGSQVFLFPTSGWIVNSPTTGTVFGLTGGTSSTKTNAPTIEINLDASRQITGWVTQSSNTNDDNIGFWAATDQVLSSWQYTVTAKK